VKPRLQTHSLASAVLCRIAHFVRKHILRAFRSLSPTLVLADIRSVCRLYIFDQHTSACVSWFAGPANCSRFPSGSLTTKFLAPQGCFFSVWCHFEVRRVQIPSGPKYLQRRSPSTWRRNESVPEGVAVIVAVRCQIWRTFQALGANFLCAQDCVSYWFIVSCDRPDG
jgi:hypothetical protein